MDVGVFGDDQFFVLFVLMPEGPVTPGAREVAVRDGSVYADVRNISMAVLTNKYVVLEVEGGVVRRNKKRGKNEEPLLALQLESVLGRCLRLENV